MLKFPIAIYKLVKLLYALGVFSFVKVSYDIACVQAFCTVVE